MCSPASGVCRFSSMYGPSCRQSRYVRGPQHLQCNERLTFQCSPFQSIQLVKVTQATRHGCAVIVPNRTSPAPKPIEISIDAPEYVRRVVTLNKARGAPPAWCHRLELSAQRTTYPARYTAVFPTQEAKTFTLHPGMVYWNFSLTYWNFSPNTSSSPPPLPLPLLLSHPQQGAGKQPTPVLAFCQRSCVGIQELHLAIGILQHALHRDIRCDVLEGRYF